jgi:hypothetical protein
MEINAIVEHNGKLSMRHDLAYFRMAIGQRIYELLLKRDLDLAELQGGIIAFLWGLWLLLPVNSGGLYPAVFSAWVSYKGYGVVFVLLGWFQCYAVLGDVHTMRRAATFSALLVWIYIGLLLAQRAAWLLACPTAFTMAAGAALGYWRLGIGAQERA